MTWRAPPSARAAIVAAALLVLTCCRASGPPPNIYVLGDPAASRPDERTERGYRVVELTQARLPDYLDSTDIITRRADGRIEASPRARWGERLSVGVTRAVAASLAAKLPGVIITTSPPIEPPWRQVNIDIDALEARQGGQCVLVAQWSVRAGRNGPLLNRQQASIVSGIGGTSDAAVVAAMTRNVDELAARIAPALKVSAAER